MLLASEQSQRLGGNFKDATGRLTVLERALQEGTDSRVMGDELLQNQPSYVDNLLKEDFLLDDLSSNQDILVSKMTENSVLESNFTTEGGKEVKEINKEDVDDGEVQNSLESSFGAIEEEEDEEDSFEREREDVVRQSPPSLPVLVPLILAFVKMNLLTWDCKQHLGSAYTETWEFPSEQRGQ